MIVNPILPGFNPDPSLLRVGEDYFIATSTFEWFPGVQIHHSRDLVHWRLLTHPLDRVSQLNLSGIPSSGGVWAPDLSYVDGQFWLLYTVVKMLDGPYKDTLNFLVTAPDMRGPWSEPVFVNSSGFDPSFFHDEDGRTWLVNMRWDYRYRGDAQFAGILLQEWDRQAHCLRGSPVTIFTGSELGKTEGPHIYQRDGWYYLLTAEGGTEYGHAATLARSRSITGPYALSPQHPLLTSVDDPTWPLQKAGHASLVTTPGGQWYLAHLVGRPLPGTRRCNLGRETALQAVTWTTDGWLRLADGGHKPQVQVVAPALPPFPFPEESERDDFDGPELSPHFQTLRVPADPSWLSLAERPGYLRLRGRESLGSKHQQSLVARRLQHQCCQIQTEVTCDPANVQQLAGLLCWYDTQNYLYLCVSYDEQRGKCLNLLRSQNDLLTFSLAIPFSLSEDKACHLRVIITWGSAQFSYREDGSDWQDVGLAQDISWLSDECCKEGRFTGTFVGIGAQDMSGAGFIADFGYFTYAPAPKTPNNDGFHGDP